MGTGAGAQPARPVWRASSPRGLLAAVALIGAMALGVGRVHQKELAAARQAAVELAASARPTTTSPTPEDAAVSEAAAQVAAERRRIETLLAREQLDEASQAIAALLDRAAGDVEVEALAQRTARLQAESRRRAALDQAEETRRERLLATADEHWRAERYEAAIDVLQRARAELRSVAEVDRQLASYLYRRAEAHLAAGQDETAQATLEQAATYLQAPPQGAGEGGAAELRARIAAARAAIEGRADARALTEGEPAVRARVAELMATGRHDAAARLALGLRDAALAREALLAAIASDLVAIPGGTVRLRATDEAPATRVEVAPFRIARRELTRGQWALLLMALDRWVGPPPPPAEADLPAEGISRDEAAAVLGWLGLRLPTVAEWTFAARGFDESPYPWGSQPPSPSHARLAPQVGKDARADLAVAPTPLPVGVLEAGASAMGCLDMAGNVAEWTSDLAPDGALAVVLGGSYLQGVRAARIDAPQFLDPRARPEGVGVRVAADPR